MDCWLSQEHLHLDSFKMVFVLILVNNDFGWRRHARARMCVCVSWMWNELCIYVIASASWWQQTKNLVPFNSDSAIFYTLLALTLQPNECGDEQPWEKWFLHIHNLICSPHSRARNAATSKCIIIHIKIIRCFKANSSTAREWNVPINIYKYDNSYFICDFSIIAMVFAFAFAFACAFGYTHC